MKNLRFILVLMLIFATSATYAQLSNGEGNTERGDYIRDYNKISWRVQAGMNVSNLSFDEEGYDNKAKVGFNIGFRFDKQFNRYLAIQTGLDYTLKGAKLAAEDEDIKYSAHYFQIPVLVGARYDFNTNLPIQLQFNTGPFIAFALGGKAKSSDGYSEKLFKDSDMQKAYKRFDMGWRFDLGVDINKYYVGLAYDLGFIDLNNKETKKMYEELGFKYSPVKTGNFSINVGYRF